jgi:Amt family ammonium transporter
MAIDTGDTSWMIVSTAMVFIMIGGVGFLEAGLIRAKNALGILMKVYQTAAIGLIAWFIIGFSLAFAPSEHGWVGPFDWAFLVGVGLEPLDYAPTIPGYLFFLFQGMFAAITVALISGGIAERMRFGPWLVFIFIWMIFVYAPVAHWIWGGGWLAQLGARDWAGGIVIHVAAGFASLASALVLGRRLGFGRAETMVQHNVPYQFLAAFLLWFGWNGFNGGSALASNEAAVAAIVSTNLAAAAGAITTFLAGWARSKKPSTSLAANGCIAGLAAVTPAAGFIEAWAGVVIGAVAGVVFYGFVLLFKEHWRVDDVCDVIAIHGMTGVWGSMCVALFASPYITGGELTGVVYGSTELVGVQALAIVVAAAYVFTLTYVIMQIMNKVTPIRLKPDEEEKGEDIVLHGERAYITA